MWFIVRCFSVSDNHGQTSNVIWLSTTWLLIFRLEVASKKPLTTKPAIAQIENSHCVKKGINFHVYKILYPRLLHMENAVCCEEYWIKNHKLFKINQSGQNKGHRCNMSTWHCIIYLFMLHIYALVWKKEKLH